MSDTTSWLPVAIVAAIISAAVSFIVAAINRSTVLEGRDRQTQAELDLLSKKVDADFQLALKRIDAENATAMNDHAWADYELRRDAYVRLAQLIGCLFAAGNAQDRPEFHRVARQVRLVGSDDVVRALNALTSEIRVGERSADPQFRALFNAMRRDIRRFHSLPAEGTDLGEDAFPIES